MLRSPKFLADLLTGSRAVVALVVLGAAWYADEATVPWVAIVVIGAWSGDMIDGWLAQQGGDSPIAWVGEQDHPIDLALATTTLLYLWRVELVPTWLLVGLAAGALLLWLRLRSDWALMSFNTSSHLVALSALFSAAPAIAGAAVGWGAVIMVAGRHRALEMVRSAHIQLRQLLRSST